VFFDGLDDEGALKLLQGSFIYCSELLIDSGSGVAFSWFKDEFLPV
jgi:hypothetical protein